MILSSTRMDAVKMLRPLKKIILDMDNSVNPTYGILIQYGWVGND